MEGRAECCRLLRNRYPGEDGCGRGSLEDAGCSSDLCPGEGFPFKPPTVNPQRGDVGWALSRQGSVQSTSPLRGPRGQWAMHTLTLFTTQGHCRLCVVSNIGRDARRSAGPNTAAMIPSCHPKHNHPPAPLFLPRAGLGSVSGQDWRQRGRRDDVCAT